MIILKTDYLDRPYSMHGKNKMHIKFWMKKLQRKRHFGRPTYRWEDILEKHLREICYEDVNYI
jgi:hypothetical protein